MIEFNFEFEFKLTNEADLKDWISQCIESENHSLGEINYIFCDDDYLHNLNVTFLKHDTLTDIISFDNTMGTLVSGDIFISVERVKENAEIFKVSFEEELHRVMIHGILHYLGYKDKTVAEKSEMRSKENYYLQLISN
ncbi:endoribonuclease YbeY [Polaribacter pacificus]|uniref:Endoribonuclease YbeY n=1 Tax=Polaribacter pacificus TaxID=1775173 RepID=A0A917MCH2_9FLAO|nr:rRNA maturation RNase YbeY [Polaribacter pacificus]GGG93378.1 endoribonuclease YbeY [Polaribacter pacificus]